MTIGFNAQAARKLTEAAAAKKIDVTKELTYIFNQIGQAIFKGLYSTNITIDNYHSPFYSVKTQAIENELKKLGYKIPFLQGGPTLDMKVSWYED